MITLQLKRTARHLSDDKIKDLVLANGEPLLVESTTNTSVKFDTICETQSDDGIKTVWLSNEQSELLTIKDSNPLVGTTLFVTFENGNSWDGQLSLNMVAGYAANFSYGVRYIDGGIKRSDVFNSQYNWTALDNRRVFVFDGTDWIIQKDTDYIENSILFIGNGVDTVDYLREIGTYIPVSKYVSDDMIKNGSITIKKLDPDIGLVSDEELQQVSDALTSLQTSTENNFNSVDSLISLSKTYYVKCSTQPGTVDKNIIIPNLPLIYVADSTTTIDKSKYDGLTVVVAFDYANSAVNPRIKVISSINNTIVFTSPIYVGDEPIGSLFYWKANDSVSFSYNAQDDRWYVSSTSAMRRIAGWCDENNTTMINGGMIATGSIAAESIVGGSITADQIATGSLDGRVFDSSVSSAISNLTEFKQQCASAGTIVAECHSDPGNAFKDATVSIDNMNSIMVTNDGMPLVGTSMVVKFDNSNTYQGDVYFRVTSSTFDGASYTKFSAQLGFMLGDAFVNIGSSGAQEFSDTQLSALAYYRWGDGEYRTVMFNGTYWIISITTEYLSKLAEWCLLHGQTWIGGGTIVTGTIVADQIQSGSIDTARVSLTCLAPNDYGDIINYGGIGYFEGTAGEYVTKGIRMYGATDVLDDDGQPNTSVTLTNRGMVLQIEGGSIGGWSKAWKINAERGMEITCGLKLSGIPTDSTGLSSGQVWSDNGVLKIVQ